MMSFTLSVYRPYKSKIIGILLTLSPQKKNINAVIKNAQNIAILNTGHDHYIPLMYNELSLNNIVCYETIAVVSLHDGGGEFP